MKPPVKAYHWIKVYTSLLDDPRFSRLSDRAKWRYVEFLLLAAKSDAAGLIAPHGEPASVEDLAYILRADSGAIQSDITALLSVNLLEHDKGGLAVKDWTDVQGPTADETRAAWRERQARHRAKSLHLPELEQEQELDKSRVDKIRVDKSVTRDTEDAPPPVHSDEKNRRNGRSEKPALPPIERKLKQDVESWGMTYNPQIGAWAMQIGAAHIAQGNSDGVPWNPANGEIYAERYENIARQNPEGRAQYLRAHGIEPEVHIDR